MSKEWQIKNWQRKQMPRSGGERQARKIENAMGGLLREIWNEWEENGEQQQNIEVGEW